MEKDLTRTIAEFREESHIETTGVGCWQITRRKQPNRGRDEKVTNMES